MKQQIKDLTGSIYDRLSVIGFAYTKNGHAYWNCYCSCDADKPEAERKIHVKCGKYLQDGSTSSCKCKREEHIKQISSVPVEKRKNKPFYMQLKNTWRTLINRCHNPAYKRYKFYGGKNILVCNDWRDDFEAFYDWSMEHGYSKGLALNRKDQGKNYSPDNCEWVSKSLSCGNTSQNILVTIGNKSQCLAAWSREPECEVAYDTIRKRYKTGIRGIALIKKEKTFGDFEYKFKNKTQTFAEWSKELDIPLTTLKARYDKGLRGNKLFQINKKMGGNQNDGK